MGSIYSFGLIVHGWHLIRLDILYMGGIYFIWTYCTWVAFIPLDVFYMDGIFSSGLIVHGFHLHI